ncbi:MAG TPA: dihydropteroate synthase [Acidimicrobiales bacterium]|nr:dihydropteroate synthase [Acidimicrobiales bacterium]
MTLVMGVLNVTPDSFYDGGLWATPEAAIERGRQMVDDGADIVDVGGESTRPNATAVDESEELRRVVPVVRGLAGAVAGRARISVDTRKRGVAEAAIEAGATVINDVSASLWPVAAEAGAGWVAMHMRGQPADMMDLARYRDVVGEVRDYLVQKAQQASAAGVREIWVDPGIGFAKTTAHNLAILARLDDLVATGWPVVVGLSRKRFTGVLATGEEGRPAPLEARLETSLAGAVWCMAQGVAMVRVHDVKATADAAKLVGAAATCLAGEKARS